MKRANVHVKLNEKGVQKVGREITEKMLQNDELTYPCPNCGTPMILKSPVAKCPKCGYELGIKIGDTVVTD